MFDSDWLILIAFLVIIFIPASPLEHFRKNNRQTIVWSYIDLPIPYHKERNNTFIELCLQSQRYWGRKFQFKILTPETLPQYIQLPFTNNEGSLLNYNKRIRYIQYALLNQYGGIWIPPYGIALGKLDTIDCALKDKDIVFFTDLEDKSITDQIIGVRHPHHTFITEEFLRITANLYQSFDSTSDAPDWIRFPTDFDFPVLPITSDINLLLGKNTVTSSIKGSQPLIFIPKNDSLWRNHSCRWLLGATEKQIKQSCKVLSL